MSEIKVHRELYDKQIAQTALDWLADLKIQVAQDTPPEPEERLSFCVKYCSYYDASGEIGCPSTKK
jgi:hypothetical protein